MELVALSVSVRLGVQTGPAVAFLALIIVLFCAQLKRSCRTLITPFLIAV